MTKQEIRDFYGQSVYDIWLQIAMGLYVKAEFPCSQCFALADEFIAALKARPLTQQL